MKTENLMDGLLSEMNRVREMITEYESLPKCAGTFASLVMKRTIAEAEASIKHNDIIEMLRQYQALKEFQS